MADIKKKNYPNRKQLDFKLFKNLYDRVGEIGSFRPKGDNVGRPKSIVPKQEEEILVGVADEICTRRLAVGSEVSRSSVLRILHQERLYPYHFTPVQNLLEADLPARLQFARFCRARQNEDLSFLNNVLFTDEATFTRRGVLNFRNKHYWSIKNPQSVAERNFQYKFNINVWWETVGNHVLGPSELPNNLNGDLYQNFFENQLLDCFDHLPLNVIQTM